MKTIGETDEKDKGEITMYILGVHSGHNATAALLKDGKIIAAASEERFTRKKNQLGYPKEAIKFVLDFAKIKMRQVDRVVIASQDPRSHKLNLYGSAFMGSGMKSKPRCFVGKLRHSLGTFMYRHKGFALTKYAITDGLYSLFCRRGATKRMLREYAKRLRYPVSKISFVNHHEAHALAPCFNLPRNRETLILTLDGEGDKDCATVNIYDGKTATLKQIATTPKHFSIGWFYMHVTKHLGMKGNQHEFKVMGLAPYAKDDYVRKAYDRMKQAIYLKKGNPLVFDAKFITAYSDRFLEETCYDVRFDNLAGGAQLLVEELILEWARAAIKKTGIKDLAVAGGVFMNVKAAMRLAELPEVKSLFVMPSAADESLVFGACFHGYQEYCKEQKIPFKPQPITNLYLGKEYSEAYVRTMVKKKGLTKRYKITKYPNIEKEIAKLLAKGEVVARHNGRSEWGARALGNRSILANPTNDDTVRVINELIKGRDFWMPFTPSILPQGEKKYIINPKKIFAPYMCITFRSTELGRKHLKAAKHMYDHTIRPQVVLPDWNPSYHATISAFEKLTGLSGVLNTSFNLHGEPNVETPEDAIHTVDNSGLKYLAIGNLLFEKKNA